MLFLPPALKLIRLRDKYFEPLISHDELIQVSKSIGKQISLDYVGKELYLLVVLSGAYRFASALSDYIDIPAEVGFVKVSSYKGTSSTGQFELSLSLPDLSGKDVLIIEDIVDTGETLHFLKQQPGLQAVSSLRTASLLVKEPNQHHLNYLGFTIPDKFVVGFGLDYDGLGRNLNDIYQLTRN